MCRVTYWLTLLLLTTDIFLCLKYQTKNVMPWTIRKLIIQLCSTVYMWHIYRLINLSIWSTLGEIVIKKRSDCVCVFFFQFYDIARVMITLSCCLRQMWQFLAIFLKLKGICDSQKYSFFKIFFIKWENFTTKKVIEWQYTIVFFFFFSPNYVMLLKWLWTIRIFSQF
jgi:hypothetical protein